MAKFIRSKFEGIFDMQFVNYGASLIRGSGLPIVKRF